jgi:hypothetical protein
MPAVPALTSRSAIVLDVAAAVFALIAFLHGRQITADLDWPGDPDMFRDLAVAQSLVDCRCLDDPHYRGELLWYNPLTAGVVAAVATATDRPVHVVQVRDGAWLNLLAPVAFYAVVARLGGRLAALPALVAFLFLGPGRLFDTSSYSPWLMSPNFGQAFLYLGVAAYVWAADGDRLIRWLVAGLVAGLAVLGHTAVAIVLAAVIGVDAAMSLRASGPPGRLLARAAVLAGAAMAVASPFLYAILWHYGADVVNPVPTVWIDRSMEIDRLGTFVRGHFWRPVMAPVAVGLIAAIAGVVTGRARRVLVVWSVVCLGLLSYEFVWQWYRAQGVTLPTMLPGFHFLRLLDAAESVWFGIGAAALVTVGVSRVARPVWQVTAAVVLVVITCAGAAWLAWPGYRQRHDFVAMRTSSQQMYRDEALLGLRDWLRTSTPRHAVVLADAGISFAVVAPAGRRVIEVPAFFSNTFVDWGERHDAANAMWAALTSSNCAGLDEIASRFDVDYAVDQAGARWTRSIEAACGWTPAFSAGDWRVFARPLQRP